MIRRISFIVAALAILAAAHPATAQQSAMPVVGWLNPQPLKSNRDRFAAFLKGLGEGGFVEGKT